MSHIGPMILAGPEEDNIGSQFDDRVPLEEAHCVRTLVESRPRDSEGPAAAVARVHPAVALRSVVLAFMVNATGGEVKNSLMDCVTGVKCSVIYVGSRGLGEPQSEVSVAGSSSHGRRLCSTGTEPILEETDTLLEVRGFTLTTLSHTHT